METPMSLNDLKYYWKDQVQNILNDNTLSNKDRYYQFLNAYETYVFYGGEPYENIFEIEDIARSKTNEYNLTSE